MLDFFAMAYWRKLLLLVLLVLSVPLQSLAAVSAFCATAEDGHAGVAPLSVHVHLSAPADDHAVMADHDDGHGRRHHDAGRGAHPCPTCASCCTGAALPTMAAVFAPDAAARCALPLPPDAGVASFLTGRIERPPRPVLG